MDSVPELAERVVEELRPDEPAPLPRAADDDDDMPLPSDARTVAVCGLFFLAVLAALYVASEIILPVVLAIVLKLLLQPLVRTLERLSLPRPICALLAILFLVMLIAGLASSLAGPGASWAAKLPDALPRIEQKLAFLQRPIGDIQNTLQQLQSFTNGGAAPFPQAAAVHSTNILGLLLTGTATAAAGVFTTLIVLFYLLVSGEIFLRRVVEILPRFREKRQAVETSLHIERNISIYLVTVTLINAAVGFLTCLIMWGCGVANPLLWGTIAFVLNFVPILGAMVGIVIFLMAGIISLGVEWSALVPVGLYFVVHVIEGEVATPMLLARRFTINPVAVILALIFWYWMWGVPGALLAVPMLAITKIICDDFRPLRAWGHLLEG